ncbi:unnamed protein product [Toxocara canis]|uniref:CAAX prenyl protease 2 n=1 Tax=Toxocara canis TaxID=6265 RepID=A0A183UQS7_TOXCA|nr:unnamed protein product [Toxocara canis]
MECTFNLMLAAGISCSYVGLLYAFDFNGVDRNDPQSIRRRFVAAVVNNAGGISITYAVLRRHHAHPFEVMGIHTNGALSAVVIPACLTSVCYLGTWVMTYIDGHIGSLFDLSQWRNNFSSLIWIRDTIMAPLTEELAFRACTTTLVLQCVSPMLAVFIAPLPFALSHLHHVFDDMKRGQTRQQAVLRRGNILAPIISHSICNNMGLPLFEYIDQYPKRATRTLLWCSYIFGFAAWVCLLMPLTDANLYS